MRVGQGRAESDLAGPWGYVSGVRLPAALNHSLWGDEIASARVLVQPELSDVLLQVRLRESTPPGWYVLSWLVHRGGVPLQDLRLLSVLASALLAALVVVDADRLMPLWAAALAGLAVALGFQFVAHGTEMRAYALFALLAVLFAVALEAAASEPTRRRLLLFGACVAAGMLTHYFFFLTLVTGIAWLWSTPWPRLSRRSRGSHSCFCSSKLA